jgi:protein tyrosine kinase modulator
VIPGKNYAPEELLAIVWERKWLVATCLTLGGVLAFAFGKTLPQRYSSETVIMLAPQRVGDGVLPESKGGKRVEDRLRSIPQEVKSRARLERVIDEFHLYGDHATCRTKDEIIDCMRTDTDIRIVGSDSFRISYLAPDPLLAMRVTERLAAQTIDEIVKDATTQREKTRVFLDDALITARKKLEEHEKKLEDYRRTYGGELPDQLQGNHQMLQNAQAQVQTLQDSLSRDRDRRLTINRELADLLADVPVDAPSASGAPSQPSLSPMAAQLDKERENLKALRKRYTEEHPDVILAQKAVRDLELQVARETVSIRNGDRTTPAPAVPPSARAIARQDRVRELRLELDNTDRQIASKLVDERRVRETIDLMRRRIDATPTRQSDLVALTRDYETHSKFYTDLLATREKAQIENKANPEGGAHFKVLDPPRVPRLPSSPNMVRITATGSALGLGLALALIALFEYRNKTLRDEDEVTACTGLPVIAVIPLMVPLPVTGSGPRLKRMLGPLSGLTAGRSRQ